MTAADELHAAADELERTGMLSGAHATTAVLAVLTPLAGRQLTAHQAAAAFRAAADGGHPLQETPEHRVWQTIREWGWARGIPMLDSDVADLQRRLLSAPLDGGERSELNTP